MHHAAPAVGAAHGCRNETETMNGEQAGGVMWQVNVHLRSVPAQHTHTEAPYAQILKAESQVQCGQVACTPKIVTLAVNSPSA